MLSPCSLKKEYFQEITRIGLIISVLITFLSMIKFALYVRNRLEKIKRVIDKNL
jgi:hypothetical protein